MLLLSGRSKVSSGSQTRRCAKLKGGNETLRWGKEVGYISRSDNKAVPADEAVNVVCVM